jgi:hypothetical protein
MLNKLTNNNTFEPGNKERMGFELTTSGLDTLYSI